jgi:hypothetical protein
MNFLVGQVMKRPGQGVPAGTRRLVSECIDTGGCNPSAPDHRREEHLGKSDRANPRRNEKVRRSGGERIYLLLRHQDGSGPQGARVEVDFEPGYTNWRSEIHTPRSLIMRHRQEADGEEDRQSYPKLSKKATTSPSPPITIQRGTDRERGLRARPAP